MIAYKVTSEGKSIFARGRFSLEYEINKITKKIPDTIGIMCFDSIESAVDFLYVYFTIWEAMDNAVRIYKVEGIEPQPYIDVITGETNEGGLLDYYDLKKKKKHIKAESQFFRSTPPGTVFFNKTKLLKEVKYIDLLRAKILKHL
jgi:hypothetical protein